MRLAGPFRRSGIAAGPEGARSGELIPSPELHAPTQRSGLEGPEKPQHSVDSTAIDRPGGVRWRLALVAGTAIGTIVQLLLYPIIFGYVLAVSLLGLDGQPERFGYAVGAWGLPLAHALLIVAAAFWVARRAGGAAVVHGILIALTSVASGQLVALLYGPLYIPELAKYLALALAGGLAGGAQARGTLAYQDALYRAGRAVRDVHTPQGTVDAVQDNPPDPRMVGVALATVAREAAVEGDFGERGDLGIRLWSSRGWPGGSDLEGFDALAEIEDGSPHTLLIEELSAHERTAWRERGVRSALLVPLTAPGGQRVGMLAVASRSRRFSQSGIRFYQTIGAQLALALENARLLEEARNAGILRERQRMAHEIHDTLAQGFTSIVINLEAAKGAMPPQARQVRYHLDQIALTARESLAEARRLVWALRPGALDEDSLPEALGRLADRWARESGVFCSFTATGVPHTLPGGIETALFRVAQEALSNARKHAGASRIALTLSYLGDVIALDIRDDGAGFDPTVAPVRARACGTGGFGLTGMRERIEECGGSLSVESAPGEGTTLAVWLPMNPEPGDEAKPGFSGASGGSP